jgi:hypothetical protein
MYNVKKVGQQHCSIEVPEEKVSLAKRILKPVYFNTRHKNRSHFCAESGVGILTETELKSRESDFRSARLPVAMSPTKNSKLTSYTHANLPATSTFIPCRLRSKVSNRTKSFRLYKMCVRCTRQKAIARNVTVFPEGISEPSGPTINVAFRGQQPVQQDYLWRWTRLSRVSSPGSNHWTKAQNALSLSLTHTHTHRGTQKNNFLALYHTDSPYFIWQNTNFA